MFHVLKTFGSQITNTISFQGLMFAVPIVEYRDLYEYLI